MPPVTPPVSTIPLKDWTPQQWINYAWNQFPTVTPDSARAQDAWALLQSIRQHSPGPAAVALGITGIPNIPDADKFMNLAYAEHFLYSRFVVGVTGDIDGQNALTYGYEGAKAKAYYLDKNTDQFKVSPYKPVPPSLDAIGWGVKGSEQGLKDWQKEHPGQKPVFGPAIKVHTGFIADELHLKPQDQQNIEKSVDAVIKAQKTVQDVQGKIDTRIRIEELKAIIEIMKFIQKNFPKSKPNSETAACLASNPDAEMNVSGTVSPSAGASDPGTLA
jgi:hypothetical protein